MEVAQRRCNHHHHSPKYTVEVKYESCDSDEMDRSRKRKKLRKRRHREYQYHTPDPDYPRARSNDEASQRSRLAGHLQNISESRVHHAAAQKKRKGKTRPRTRSIDINIRTEVPPCEPQKKTVAERPCHRKWNLSYHPTAGSQNTTWAEGSSSCEEEEEKRRSIEYFPEEQCAEPSGPESFFTKHTKRCIEDRVIPTQRVSDASKVDITITMSDHEPQLNRDTTVQQRERSLSRDRHQKAEGYEPRRISFENNEPFNPHQRQPPVIADYDSDEDETGIKNRHDRGSLNSEDGEENGRLQPPLPPPPPRSAPPIPPRITPVRQPETDSFPDWFHQEAPRASPHRHPPNVFPFKETASGNVRIDRNLISFQTPKVAVLVADPDRTRLNVKDEHTSNSMTMTATFHNKEANSHATTSPRNSWEEEEDDYLIARTAARSQPPPVDRGYETEPSAPNGHYGGRGSRGSKTLMENLHYRLKRAINPDMKIVIGEKEFPVHGIALQSYSKYIDKQRRSKSQIMEIRIPEEVMSSADFPSLMDWILMDEREKPGVIDRGNAVGLFSGATFLSISQLREDCLEFIRHRVEEGDASILAMYEEARGRNLPELISLLATKLAGLFPKIYKSGQFLRMSAREIILVLSADNISIHSELDVYDAAVRWLLYDWGSRKEHTVEVMKTVRFGLLTPLQLTQIRFPAESAALPDYPQIFSYAEVRKLVEQATTYSILKENYQGHPGELQRWLKATGVEPPRERRNIRLHPESTRSQHRERSSVSHEQERYQRKEKKKRRSISQEVFDTSAKQMGESSVFAQQQRRHHHHHEKRENPDNRDNQGAWESLETQKEEEEAAVLIQSAMRGWLARSRFRKLKHAALAAQAAVRAAQKKIPIRPSLKSKKGETVIVLGGHDPNLPDTSNVARAIYKLDFSANVWKLKGHLPAPRLKHGTVHIGNFIYVFGGEDPTVLTERGKNKPSPATWALNLLNGKWRLLSKMNTARTYFGYAMSHGRIFVFGGVDKEGAVLTSCESYDPREDAWHEIRGMDGPRFGCAVAKSGDKIWITGGLTKRVEMPMLKTTIIYDLKKNIFYAGPDLPFPRCYATLTAYYDQLILIGGATWVGKNGSGSTSDVSRLHNGEWVSVGHLKTGPRHGHSELRIGKYVLIVGGVNSETKSGLSEIESYNVEKFRGSTNVADLPLKLTGLSGVVIATHHASHK